MMKNLRFYLMLAGISLVSLTFNSCLDDDGYSLGDMWLSIVTVEAEEAGSNLYFRLDGGETLWPAAGYYMADRFDNKQRAILNYTILSDSVSGFSHYVKVNSIDPLLTKDIAENKSTENDEYYGTDPVGIRKLWIGDGYLNIAFEANFGGMEKHFVNLVNMSDEENPFRYEFRHNAYDDPQSYGSVGIVCFKLQDIDTAGQTITMTINVKTFDGDKSFTLEYNPGQPMVTEEKLASEISSGSMDKIN